MKRPLHFYYAHANTPFKLALALYSAFRVIRFFHFITGPNSSGAFNSGILVRLPQAPAGQRPEGVPSAPSNYTIQGQHLSEYYSFSPFVHTFENSYICGHIKT